MLGEHHQGLDKKRCTAKGKPYPLYVVPGEMKDSFPRASPDDREGRHAFA
jgi:hypothetical protein